MSRENKGAGTAPDRAKFLHFRFATLASRDVIPSRRCECDRTPFFRRGTIVLARLNQNAPLAAAPLRRQDFSRGRGVTDFHVVVARSGLQSVAATARNINYRRTFPCPMDNDDDATLPMRRGESGTPPFARSALPGDLVGLIPQASSPGLRNVASSRPLCTICHPPLRFGQRDPHYSCDALDPKRLFRFRRSDAGSPRWFCIRDARAAGE